MKIGIAGTGRMGTAIARRLMERGYEVSVWNRTPANSNLARAAGAEWAPTPLELASNSEVVISFLLDNSAVERVYLGQDGFVAAPIDGRLFIDMSTVSPQTHAPIARALAARGAAFVECPVSGSVPTASAGTLVGFAGADYLDFARAQTVLRELCRRVEHVGPVGDGARMKLASNLLLTVFWQALGESLLLVDSVAMGESKVLELLSDSNIGATLLRARAGQITAALDGRASSPAEFDIDTMRKDLRYMALEASAESHSLPLASRVLGCFDRASSEGLGAMDGSAYPAYWIARQKAVVA